MKFPTESPELFKPKPEPRKPERDDPNNNPSNKSGSENNQDVVIRSSFRPIYSQSFYPFSYGSCADGITLTKPLSKEIVHAFNKNLHQLRHGKNEDQIGFVGIKKIKFINEKTSVKELENYIKILNQLDTAFNDKKNFIFKRRIITIIEDLKNFIRFFIKLLLLGFDPKLNRKLHIFDGSLLLGCMGLVYCLKKNGTDLDTKTTSGQIKELRNYLIVNYLMGSNFEFLKKFRNTLIPILKIKLETAMLIGSIIVAIANLCKPVEDFSNFIAANFFKSKEENELYAEQRSNEYKDTFVKLCSTLNG